MKSPMLTALSSKVAIGVAAGTLAFGSAGAVFATQSIGSSSDDTPETTTTPVDDTTALDEETTVEDEATIGDEVTEESSDDSFSAQVRELAQDDDREGGIGEEVSRLAHERNEARHGEDDLDDEDEEDEDEDARRGPSANRGPGHADDDSDDDSDDGDDD
jgi:hypothetical protein